MCLLLMLSLNTHRKEVMMTWTQHTAKGTLNGLSPVWSIWWTLSFDAFLNVFLHPGEPHINNFLGFWSIKTRWHKINVAQNRTMEKHMVLNTSFEWFVTRKYWWFTVSYIILWSQFEYSDKLSTSQNSNQHFPPYYPINDQLISCHISFIFFFNSVE